jgi:hypothetical protein
MKAETTPRPWRPGPTRRVGSGNPIASTAAASSFPELCLSGTPFCRAMIGRMPGLAYDARIARITVDNDANLFTGANVPCRKRR